MRNCYRYLVAGLVVAVISLTSTAPARAGLIALGDPVEGNSWNQSFRYADDSGGFDLFAVKISKGLGMKMPSIQTDRPGWTTRFESQWLSSKRGDHATSLDFDLHFWGDIPQLNEEFEFHFASFSNESFGHSAKVSWVESSLQIEESVWEPTFEELVEEELIISLPPPPAHAPEPTSLAIFSMVGFGMIGAARRRRKKSQR